MDYNIFRTLYCSSRYSERLYFAYYDRKYREQAWTQNGYDLSCCEEVGDHGILGGYMLFQRLCASEEKPVPPRSKKLNEQETFDLDRKEPIHYHQERIPMYQDICFRIMEHNIWKEDKHLPLDDPFREIDAEHFRNIDQEEPLLFLLCLVDTIEMTKRFCRYSDSGTEKTTSSSQKLSVQKCILMFLIIRSLSIIGNLKIPYNKTNTHQALNSGSRA